MHNTFFRVREVDLQFQVIPSPGFTWNYNSGGTNNSQFSFETIALHELGHVHGMGHVIDNNKVMHFSSSNGSQSVLLAASDIAAGNYKVDNSTGTNCFPTPGPMVELINPCIPLPIDLVSFEAIELGTDNKVIWQTANEVGIGKYIVEHSTNGVNFYPLGEVLSKDDSEENQYDFVHQNPTTHNYYRLQIVDKDENVTYSLTVYLSRNKKNGYTIFPNPTKDFLNIKISNLSLRTNHIVYSIRDMNGKVWSTKDTKVDSKELYLTESMKTLPAGIYFIELSINGTSSTKKIVRE